MEYRELGSTGERIPAIGMGTWKMGSFHDASERSRQVQALRLGIDLGMTLIDTAEMYSGGKSEEVVGEAVKGQRDRVFIASKVSPGNLRHDDVIRSCEASLKRLGTTYLDLYQVHWPNPDIPIPETMRAMQELVRREMVRFVGVSNFSVDQTRDAQAALPRSGLASNQVEYSIASRSAEGGLLQYCEETKVTLIAYSPLARGRLPHSVEAGIESKYGMTPAQVALNWVTRHLSVVAIPKAADARHLRENSASVDTRFTDNEYARISQSVDPTADGASGLGPSRTA